MPEYELVRVTRDEDWAAYHDIRRTVLWEARGRFTYDPTYPDEYVPDHHPLLLKQDGAGIGTTRLDDRRDGTAIVRLVAIRQDAQGSGHGRVLQALVEEYAAALGIGTLA